MALGITDKRVYLSIADGKLRRKSDAGDPEAKRREIIDKKTKAITIKYEKVYDFIEGVIESLEFYEHEQYGTFINIGIEGVIVSLNTASKYGQSFMVRFPNIQIDKPVKIIPYSFEDSKNKDNVIQGLNVYQGEKKLEDYYYDAANKKSKNGILDDTQEEKEKYDSDDWKFFFAKRRKFLIAEIEKTPMVQKTKEQHKPADKIEYPEEEINPDDIPF